MGMKDFFLKNFHYLYERNLSPFFSFSSSLPSIHILASVCRRWRQIAYDTKLWKNVSLRPEVSGECDSELIKVNKLTFHNFFHFHISLLSSPPTIIHHLQFFHLNSYNVTSYFFRSSCRLTRITASVNFRSFWTVIALY